MENTERKKNRVFVIGVGLTKFMKPGRPENPDYPEFAKQAVQRALRDAGITYNEIEQAAVGFVYGDSCCGQRALYEVGITGIPIYNVNNNCATGSTAIYLAHQFIESGISNCVLALGFEKMKKGSLASVFNDRANPIDNIFTHTFEINPDQPGGPFAAMIFGNAGIEHMKKYGTKPEHFAKIAYKNHKHSGQNPYSQFKDYYKLDQILAAPRIYGPLTKLQCCPTSDGAGACVLASEKFVIENGLENQAVEIIGISMKTDPATSFSEKSLMNLAGYEMTRTAAEDVFKKTGADLKDVCVVEMHDCFSANELITYEALGLCPQGKAGEWIDRGEFTYGGKYVVNPSGGLISKGHPLGATGLAQCAELCWQLRNMAENRQVENAYQKLALQQNIGLGGAVIVTLYKRYKQIPNGTTRPDQSANPDVLEKQEKSASPLLKNNIKGEIITMKAKL